MTCSAEVVEDYVSRRAPRWAGPGSEGGEASLEVVPGVRRGSSGSRGRGVAAGRLLRCRRPPEPIPFLTQPHLTPQSQRPTPVSAADRSVTMNPAVFLAFPDLRCSLLLLVSEGSNDRPFDRRAGGGRPSPRGNTSAPTPAFLFFFFFPLRRRGIHPPWPPALSAFACPPSRPGVREA